MQDPISSFRSNNKKCVWFTAVSSQPVGHRVRPGPVCLQCKALHFGTRVISGVNGIDSENDFVVTLLLLVYNADTTSKFMAVDMK